MMIKTEEQYLQLFRENREAIDSHSPRVLNAKREAAFAAFESKGLPPYGSENYQRTVLSELFSRDYGVNLNRVNFPIKQKEAFRCTLPDLDTDLCYIVNDAYDSEWSQVSELPAGTFVGSLSDFALNYPDVAAQYYAQAATPDHDGIVAFNTMFAQDGFVIYLPDGVVLPNPIQLVQLLRADMEILATRRMLIILGKGAEASLLICEHTLDAHSFLTTEVVEIFAAADSRFALYDLEESSKTTHRIASVHVRQAANSNVIINSMTIHNGLTRNNYYCHLEGENADLTLGGMAIAESKQHVDNYSRIEHLVPNCQSNELFKYVLSKQAQGAFSGRIYVAKGAQKTAAYQNNRNLLLDDTARMYSKPQLEIYADDVKCSHGMTTGQLDDEALFYMRQRGIPMAEAKTMLSVAFTDDVVKLVHIEQLRDRLRDIIEHRFRGGCMRCGSCNICY